VLPYSYKSYGAPTSCFIEDRTRDDCNAKYLASACNPSSFSGEYPLYDARCRRWYQIGTKPGATTREVYFDYPRVASTGDLVITTAAPIRRHGDDNGELHGVLNLNVLAATLSDSVNQLKIIDNGYVYIVDATNTSNVVLHPRLSKTCTSFRCCEDSFSDAEFAAFHAAVLAPLQAGNADDIASSSFVKGGKEWRFALAPVRYGTVNYVLFATVPRSDILKSSAEVTNQIEASNTGIIIAASFTLFVFICLIVYATMWLVRGITGPVSDLTALCEDIMQGNLHSSSVPEEASSSDMLQLLAAFTNMLTALRFGSDSYARGDIGVAMALFEEALELYTASHNDKGVGACHNNLGAVHMSMGNHEDAARHYDLAIGMASAAVVSASEAASLLEAEVEPSSTSVTSTSSTTAKRRPSPTTVIPSKTSSVAHLYGATPDSDPRAPSARTPQERLRAAQKTLSDRKGNLALLYIAQERYPDAFQLLESCMEEDRRNGYIRGCVVKQGNMGHLYMKQGTICYCFNISLISYCTSCSPYFIVVLI